jgi:hypothetical protein
MSAACRVAARVAARLAPGLLAAAFAGGAAAQQTVRELMDGGGRMASAAELRTLLGLAPAPGAPRGAPGAGSQVAPSGAGNATATRIDEAGRGCIAGDCRWYWRTQDGRWFVSSSPDLAAPISPGRAP